MTSAIMMLHEIDPKLEINNEVKGLIDDVEPLGAECIIGIYVRPTKTKGGILLADNTKGEDLYQGKIGLVLKKGPLAFQSDDTHHWGDKVPQVGDWVLFRIGDTFPFILGARSCRFVEDVNVKAIVHRPDIIL